MAVGRILVLGAGGMLGHKMLQVLFGHFSDVWGTLRDRRSARPWSVVPLLQSDKILEGVDLSNVGQVEDVLQRLRPRYVLNCAGVIKQRPSSSDPIAAIGINALLPHLLARTLARWDGRLVHFSTDCVFSGRRGSYTEDDIPDAEDLYGRTKALGEVTAWNALTLRTSIIGRELRHRASLLEWFLAHDHGTVPGYRRVWWSGVTTNHLAALVTSLLERTPELSGLYQVAMKRISKYDLLCRLKEAYRLDIRIEPTDDPVSDRSLRGERFERATGYCAPSWGELAPELAADPTPYREWKADDQGT